MGKKYTADDFVGAVTGNVTGSASLNILKGGDTMTGTLTNTATNTTTRINNTNAQTGAGMLSFQADSGSISDKFVFSRSGSGGQQAAIKFEETSGTYADNLVKFELSEPNSYSSTDYFELRHSSASSSNRYIKAHQPLIAGGGIYLGTTSKSASNHLDDYEEGTWTPAVSGFMGGMTNTTYNVQVGTYTKIGNLVRCTFRLNFNSTIGTVGNVVVFSGLPFAPDAFEDESTFVTIGDKINVDFVYNAGSNRVSLSLIGARQFTGTSFLMKTDDGTGTDSMTTDALKGSSSDAMVLSGGFIYKT